ncbi:MAG: hypothetical protein LBC87_00140 [Fibromonadaceae bacterium]|jgi:hypothetical protein|nr:hypothetical protein [Fibromonadaceae bacterium]
MNVSTVANWQYGVCGSQPNTINKTSNFADILQGQLQKPQGSLPPPPQESLPIYDLGSGKEIETTWWHDISTDPELHVYAMQLAVELGITKNDVFASNFQMPDGIKIRPIKIFYGALQELLDEGLISKKDIIDKVKYQPELLIGEDGGYVTKLNQKDIETEEPFAFYSTMDLFERIWGKDCSL